MDVGVILGSTFAAMVVVILCIGIPIIAVVYLRRKQHAKKVDLTRHVILIPKHPSLYQHKFVSVERVFSLGVAT